MMYHMINGKPLRECQDSELLEELRFHRENPAAEGPGSIDLIEQEIVLRERARTGDWRLSEIEPKLLHP